jgi:hypothetical protein
VNPNQGAGLSAGRLVQTRSDSAGIYVINCRHRFRLADGGKHDLTPLATNFVDIALCHQSLIGHGLDERSRLRVDKRLQRDHSRNSFNVFHGPLLA